MRVAIDPTLTRLLRDVSAGIRVLQVRDGIVLSESQILERARNIVMGLIGNYRIETLERGDDGRAATAAASAAAATGDHAKGRVTARSSSSP